METLVAIAMLALSLFGPGWSSEHKAFWEWQLGHKLEGYEEHRLSRGWCPDGGGPIFAPTPCEAIRERPPEDQGIKHCFLIAPKTMICHYHHK